MPSAFPQHERPDGPPDRLEDFYEKWSEKAPALIEYDIMTAGRKADTILSRIPRPLLADVRRVMDFGCGYGSFLRRVADLLELDEAVGVDYSAGAVAIAAERFERPGVRFAGLPTLDPGEMEEHLRRLVPGGTDCIALIDVLEHVPDCRTLMSVLSETARTFIVKLPVENTVFDNYVRRKEYPSPAHSNGHLREFTVNDVHYFIRRLGLTPLYEEVYVYPLDETFPPPAHPLSALGRVKRAVHVAFRATWKALLPKRAFLRLVGGGGYFCIATYSPSNILEP